MTPLSLPAQVTTEGEQCFKGTLEECLTFFERLVGDYEEQFASIIIEPIGPGTARALLEARAGGSPS